MAIDFSSVLRLVSTADQRLATTGEHLETFVTIANARSTPTWEATAKSELLAARDSAAGASESLAEARAGVEELGELAGGPVMRTALDDARRGVDGLTEAFQRMHDSPGPADQNALRTTIADTRTALGGVQAHIPTAEQIVKAGDAAVADAAAMDELAARMPTLNEVGTDMLTRAKDGAYGELIGREQEVDELIATLGRRQKGNPVLIGPAGVGKTQIVEGLMRRVQREEVPADLRDLRIFSLTGADLIAAGDGKVEALVKKILEEVVTERQRGGNVAVFMDEIHTLADIPGVMNQLKPALARGDLRLLGASTGTEFRQAFAKDEAFLRRITEQRVEEGSVDDTLAILRSQVPSQEAHHGIVVHDSALREAIELGGRYVKDRKMPDPQIELLDHAMSRVASRWGGAPPPELARLRAQREQLQRFDPQLERQADFGDAQANDELMDLRAELADLEPRLARMEWQNSVEQRVLGRRDRLVSQYTAHANVGETAEAQALRPRLHQANQLVEKLRERYPDRVQSDLVDVAAIRSAAESLYGHTISGGADEAERMLALEGTLNSLVIGQPGAVKHVADTMIGLKSGMKDPDTPAGAFLFRGPTGVGKTELVRAASGQVLGDVKRMVRLDMGEYSEPHSVSRLFGAPPGYVGYGEQKLLDALKDPEVFVLFDEVEKAHPDVFQKLLALFEEGRVQGGDNTVVDATSATLFMTTNLPEVATFPGQRTITSFFSPEFLNRLDAVVEFSPLDRESLTKILDLQLTAPLKRGVANGIDVQLTDAARERLAELGYDPAMGARPVKRAVKHHLTNPMGQLVLEMRVAGRPLDPARPESVVFDIDGENLLLRTQDGAHVVPIVARPPEPDRFARTPATSFADFANAVPPVPGAAPATATGGAGA